MTIPARLLRAYRRSIYQVGDWVLRIGRPAPLSGVLITAWNPMSRRMPDGWNRRMQQRLVTATRRWPTLPASGGLERWQEDHLCVEADPRPCRVIGRRFRQLALVILRRGRPIRLMLL